MALAKLDRPARKYFWIFVTTTCDAVFTPFQSFAFKTRVFNRSFSSSQQHGFSARKRQAKTPWHVGRCSTRLLL